MMSAGTSRSEFFRTTSSTVSESNENQNGLEGYDYDFVPSLDNKHMCPICLLALRDPVQTVCGHRFCEPCISRSLEIKQTCPVDNATLHPSQLFQDKYARREVLDLKAKCPNKGCEHVCELRLMEPHSKVCEMRKFACKNKCGLTLLYQDLIYHEENQCPTRPVTCNVCGQTYPLASEERHKEECVQHQLVNCPHCKYELKQYRLQSHITTECLQAPIKCVFEKVGCPQELPRHSIQKHMEKSTQIHLQYLLSSVSQASKTTIDLSSLLKTLTTRVNSLESGSSQYDTNDDNIEIYDRDDQGLPNGYGKMPGASRRFHADSSDEEEDEIAKIKKHNYMMENQPSTASSSKAMAEPTAGPSSSTSRQTSVLSTDIEEKIIGLDHHVRELMAKMDTQVTGMRDLTVKLNSVEQRLSQQELKCCNGLYFWKIRDYSRLRKAASTGEVSVLHSPGFYTSPHGYRICVRVNLDGVETAQGTHLSLFVHIMKGDNDDLLVWPFQGVITLTVVNQRDLPQDRSHISETLFARSNLMAFQRPISERNQKGYGYIDFFPLNMIESEGFIKSDTLVIKAQVRVDPPPVNSANHSPKM